MIYDLSTFAALRRDEQFNRLRGATARQAIGVVTIPVTGHPALGPI